MTRRQVLSVSMSILSVLYLLIASNTVSADIVLSMNRPTGLRVDAQRVYVSYGGLGIVAVYDTRTLQQTNNIAVGPNPAGLDLSPDGSELYVGIATGLAIVDTTSMTLSGTISLPGAGIDVAAGRTSRVFVATTYRNASIVDTVRKVEIGRIEAPDFIATFGSGLVRTNLNRNIVYIGTTPSTATILYSFNLTTDKPSLLGQTIYGSLGPLEDMTVDPAHGYLYVATPDNIAVFNPTNWTRIGTLETGAYATSVSLTKNGTLAFVTHTTYEVQIFSTSNGQLLKTYSTSKEAQLVRVLPDGSQAFVITEDIYTRAYRFEEIDTAPPAWPAGSSVTASNVNATSLTLTWTPANDNVGVASYRILINGNAWVTSPGDSLQYRFPGQGALAPGTTYVFSVEAADASQNLSHGGPQVTVAMPTIPVPEARLYYKLAYTFPVYPGGTTLLISRFSNQGSFPLKVDNLNVRTDFGTFTWSPPPPTSTGICTVCDNPSAIHLDIGETKALNLTANIPSNVGVGNHTITATVSWDFFARGGLGYAQWNSAPLLSVTGQITISAFSPGNTQHSFTPTSIPITLLSVPTRIFSSLSSRLLSLDSMVYLELGVYLVVALLVASIAIVQERRRNARKMNVTYAD